MVDAEATNSDVVVSIGRKAILSALIEPLAHENVAVSLVRMVEVEAVIGCYIHQVTLWRLEIDLNRPGTLLLPLFKGCLQLPIKLVLTVGQQVKILDNDAFVVVHLDVDD